MAKRKRTKKYQFQGVGTFLRVFFQSAIKLIPIFLIAGLFYWGISGMKSYLEADPNLQVTNIRLITDGDFTREEILKKTGIVSGKSIFQFDLKKIAKVLEQDPKIRQVIIKKEFPNTLLLDIRIRHPYLWMHQGAAVGFVLDEDGYVISFASEKPAGEIHEVEDQAAVLERVNLGDRYFTGNMENALFVIRYLQKEQVLSQVSVQKILIDRIHSLNLILSGGAEVRLGSNRLLKALEKMPHALKILKDEGIAIESVLYIDLRFDDVIIKKK